MRSTTATHWLMPALFSVTLLASPLALAGHHGAESHHGKPPGDVCERLRAGEAPLDRDERRAAFHERMEQRRAEMADRLQLTETQREIWDQIHEEQKAEWEQHREERRARMMEHCEGRQAQD
ncbi:MAG: hypothetical protein R3175_10915 [Marinobacter sp.]|uniref:hypothetical protein n=1 Tax=Marinobacter sp. TaxID=50741 RepID=UPI00299E6A2C|nr:hypothetical protein [Marinobacter sp.]MDX1756560.1 hypothetical protein [Marinobacter sp.]